MKSLESKKRKRGIDMINLVKGQKVDLTKDNQQLNMVTVGLGWDPVGTGGAGGFFKKLKAAVVSIDCDASVFMLKNDHLESDKDIISFSRLKSVDGSVKHTGDNLTGAGDGDDEQIIVKLKEVPKQFNRLVFVVNIFGAKLKKQHFGLIQNAYIRVFDDRNQELIRFNLSDDYNEQTALIAGEIYRHNGEWKFNAVGTGTADTTISELAKRYR